MSISNNILNANQNFSLPIKIISQRAKFATKPLHSDHQNVSVSPEHSQQSKQHYSKAISLIKLARCLLQQSSDAGEQGWMVK